MNIDSLKSLHAPICVCTVIPRNGVDLTTSHEQEKAASRHRKHHGCAASPAITGNVPATASISGHRARMNHPPSTSTSAMVGSAVHQEVQGHHKPKSELSVTGAGDQNRLHTNSKDTSMHNGNRSTSVCEEYTKGGRTDCCTIKSTSSIHESQLVSNPLLLLANCATQLATLNGN